MKNTLYLLGISLSVALIVYTAFFAVVAVLTCKGFERFDDVQTRYGSGPYHCEISFDGINYKKVVW